MKCADDSNSAGNRKIEESGYGRRWWPWNLDNKKQYERTNYFQPSAWTLNIRSDTNRQLSSYYLGMELAVPEENNTDALINHWLTVEIPVWQNCEKGKHSPKEVLNKDSLGKAASFCGKSFFFFFSWWMPTCNAVRASGHQSSRKMDLVWSRHG